MNSQITKTKLISAVEEGLKRISNILLLNTSFTDNLGLLNGKMGIAIFFYHYFRYSGKNIFEDYAGELVDQIYSEISTNTSINLSDGLTGIGWGIEYLVKNGFVQADTDEALSEIDSAIYRIRLNTPVLVNPDDIFFSYGHYYISRLCGHNIDDEDINTLIKKYHLIFMIDECERIILDKHHLTNGLKALNIDQLKSITWFVREADRLGIFPIKTKKILDKIQDYYGNTLCGNKNIVPNNPGNFSFPEEELNIFIKETWQRLVYDDYSAYHPPTERLLLYISEEENWKTRLKNLKKETLGLDGLTGIGLGLLFLLIRCKPLNIPLKTENVR